MPVYGRSIDYQSDSLSQSSTIITLFVVLWLMLICCERKILLADCWFGVREKHCWLIAANRAYRDYVHYVLFNFAYALQSLNRETNQVVLYLLVHHITCGSLYME